MEHSEYSEYQSTRNTGVFGALDALGAIGSLGMFEVSGMSGVPKVFGRLRNAKAVKYMKLCVCICVTTNLNDHFKRRFPKMPVGLWADRLQMIYHT